MLYPVAHCAYLYIVIFVSQSCSGPGAEELCFIDFGSAERIVFRGGGVADGDSALVGTLRYCAINAHQGGAPTPADDLEGLSYVLIYLCNGSLPWQKRTGGTEARRQREVAHVKMSTSPHQLAKNLPGCFAAFVARARMIAGQGPGARIDYGALAAPFAAVAAQPPELASGGLMPFLKRKKAAVAVTVTRRRSKIVLPPMDWVPALEQASQKARGGVVVLPSSTRGGDGNRERSSSFGSSGGCAIL